MLDRETIERALELGNDAPLILALSGGGDSVALLHLLVEEMGAARLRAVVMDHALRAGSDTDARMAAGFAEKLGVRADIRRLSWDGSPASSRHLSSTLQASRLEAGGPSKRNQQNARRLRYTALCEATRSYGARVIFVAHTRDDQAETVFMREGAGSGWRGLAGMAALAPAPIWPEGRAIVLARPLLGVRREELRAYLRELNTDWIEDPANANPKFERVRVRAVLAEMGEQAMSFADRADRARDLVNEVDSEARVILSAAQFAEDVIALPLVAWRGSEAARQRALALLLAATAGAEREPGAEAVARLDARVSTEGFHGASLGGARISKRRGALIFSRDAGAVLGRAGGAAAMPELELPVAREIVWDGRLALTATVTGLRLKPAGAAPLIVYNGLMLPLDGAQRERLISVTWLQEQHLIHRLGLFSTTKLSKYEYSPATFTAP